jgi:hypothetical protein
MEFLETVKDVRSTSFSSGSDFSQENIKQWLAWLKNVRRCTPESCNARFSSLNPTWQKFPPKTAVNIAICRAGKLLYC